MLIAPNYNFSENTTYIEKERILKILSESVCSLFDIHISFLTRKCSYREITDARYIISIIAYKNGLTQKKIAEFFKMNRVTICVYGRKKLETDNTFKKKYENFVKYLIEKKICTESLIIL